MKTGLYMGRSTVPESRSLLHKATVSCILVSPPPPACFFRTSFASPLTPLLYTFRYHALYVSVLLSCITTQQYCKPAKICLFSKALEHAHPTPFQNIGTRSPHRCHISCFFHRGCGLPCPGTNNGTTVMVTWPHRL